MKNKINVRERVLRCIRNNLELDKDISIDGYAKLDKDLGIDSLGIKSLTLDIEDEFDIKIKIDIYDRDRKMRTVNNLVWQIERYLGVTNWPVEERCECRRYDGGGDDGCCF